MENKHKNTDLMRWAAMLSAMAVLLPSVCLLWLMMQAVKNERLAIRQKLIQIAEAKLNQAQNTLNEQCEDYITNILNKKNQASSNRIILNDQAPFAPDQLSTILIYDSKNQLVHPNLTQSLFTGFELSDDPLFESALQDEYQNLDYLSAVKKYEEIENLIPNDDNYHPRFCHSQICKARCLIKASKIDEALTTYESVINLQPSDQNQDIAIYRAMAAVSMAKNTKNTNPEKFKKTLQFLIDLALQPDSSLNSRDFILAKIDEFTNNGKHIINTPLYDKYCSCVKTILSVGIANKVNHDFDSFKDQIQWDRNTIFQLNSPEEFYILSFSHTNHRYLLVNPANLLTNIINQLQNDGFKITIKNNTNNFFNNTNSIEKTAAPLLTKEMGSLFPGWTAEIYPSDSSIFTKSAQKQVLIYKWGGFLVIIFMFLCSYMVFNAVSRQIKLNNLKNDFIATVSHELKTPLASMRVLVDTLLSGSYTNKENVNEYLMLISKENGRLSRLIENFLTFSRMERNKQSFNITSCNLKEIINDAQTATRLYFKNNNCNLEISTPPLLPDILADHDAIVTVLVNLLDNACKYSKQIKDVSINVTNQQDNVSIIVADKGIGMTMKQQKKIFEKFYQADNALSRTTEGCGLGLSIVKYILNVHNASIKVNSKIGKGTTFEVILPTA